MPKNEQILKAKVLKLVHGGQALAETTEGKKALIWNALPGEVVELQVAKRKKDFYEGLAIRILKPSPLRIIPEEESYLSTSPWQIIKEGQELLQKEKITEETFKRAGIEGPPKIRVFENSSFYGYRNKMEYSFFGDDEGLHLALHARGSHSKVILKGAKIANPVIDIAANKIVKVLEKNSIRASQLKTVVLRCSKAGEVVSSLFVKDENFKKINELSEVCEGIKIFYSNPKSPASVQTKFLYKFGDTTLRDLVFSNELSYDVNSFFQVNLDEFEKSVKSINDFADGGDWVDMYCGVGSIGVSVGANTFVESDENNIDFLRKNIPNTAIIIENKSEDALELVSHKTNLILDPPRAGLHHRLLEKIIDTKPEKIAYLSCNPSTQARDLEVLQKIYKIESLELFNFFPRTPHIETLAKLVRR